MHVQINILDFNIKRTNSSSQDPRSSQWFRGHVFVVGYHLTMSTSRLTDVIYVIGVPRPSPFFATPNFHVLH